jgi:hypothetical protein
MVMDGRVLPRSDAYFLWWYDIALEMHEEGCNCNVWTGRGPRLLEDNRKGAIICAFKLGARDQRITNVDQRGVCTAGTRPTALRNGRSTFANT